MLPIGSDFPLPYNCLFLHFNHQKLAYKRVYFLHIHLDQVRDHPLATAA